MKLPSILLTLLVLLPTQNVPAWSLSREEFAQLQEHNSRGNTYMGQRNFQYALNEYNTCLEIDPTNQVAKDNIVLLHNNWGASLFQQKKFHEAKQQWEQALKLNPHDHNALHNMAYLKATLDKLGIPLDSDEQQAQKEQEQAAKNPTPSESPKPHAVMILNGGNRSFNVPGEKPKPETGGTDEPAAHAEDRPATPPATGIDEVSGIDTSPGGTTSSGPTIIKMGTGSGADRVQMAEPPVVVATPSAPPEPTTPAPPQNSMSPYNLKLKLPASFYNSPPVKPAPTTPMPQHPPMTPAQDPTAGRRFLEKDSAAPFNPSSQTGSIPASSTPGVNLTIEEKLDRIEQNVYGKKLKSMPVLKRLERLELDTSGRPASGSINERVEILIKNYGL